MIRKFYAPDVTIGAKLTLDANDGAKTLKELKADIKEARGNLVAMQETFGATSKEARNAAKRVAELENALGDAKKLSDAFNPDQKFANLTQSLNGVLGGFAALQGAMGLLGVESEEVQKQLLKVQSALALSQGINQVGEAINSFKNFGKVIVETLGKNGLIGLAIAGVAALGAALSGVFTKTQSEGVRAYNDTLKDYQLAAAGAIQKVEQVRVAFEEARRGVISKDEALKTYNDTLGDSLGKTKDLTEAEKNLTDKADAYIKATALKAQANALFAKSAEKSADALIAQDQLIKSGLLNEGGVFTKAAKSFQERIDKTKQDAEDIKNIGADLLKQAIELEKTNKINLPAQKSTTPAKTPAIVSAEEEGRIVAKIEDDKLARTQTVNERLIQFATDLHDKLTVSGRAFTQEYLDQQDQQQKAAIYTAQLEQEKADARVQAAQAIGEALGALSELIGKQTAAGKVLAIAQATINTWTGVSEVLRAKSVLPEPAGTIAKIANVATIIATGLNAVKNIVKVPVPGGGGAGGGASLQAPIQARSDVQTTLLNQAQLNQIGNAAAGGVVRAFVVESDVTGNQERIRRLNRAARI